ncbi:Serine/arginine-rich splicing factor 12 [Oleoguttula sp. CCFEE 5521]
MASADVAIRLYVGNLLYQVQPHEVQDLFVSHGFGIKNVDMSIDPFKHRNPSYCFVDLHTAADATRAMQSLQGFAIQDRPVKIKPHTERSDRQNRPPTKSFDYGPHARIFPTRTDVHAKAPYSTAGVAKTSRSLVTPLLPKLDGCLLEA